MMLKRAIPKESLEVMCQNIRQSLITQHRGHGDGGGGLRHVKQARRLFRPSAKLTNILDAKRLPKTDALGKGAQCSIASCCAGYAKGPEKALPMVQQPCLTTILSVDEQHPAPVGMDEAL